LGLGGLATDHMTLQLQYWNFLVWTITEDK